MITVLRWLWFLVASLVLFVGSLTLLNVLTGRQQPIWTSIVLGLVVWAGLVTLLYAERRGWIRSGLWSNSEFEARRRKLADDRERILAEAQRAADER